MKLLHADDLVENGGLEMGAIDSIKNGSVFIYPTDTVYGLGCNAENRESVKRIRKIKCTDHPFSVIAPSKKWIGEHLDICHHEYMKRLPGRYTLIFRKKRKDFLEECTDSPMLGVRIPDHPFTKIVKKAAVPFVTTSANISGQPTIISVKSLPTNFTENVDIVIDGGTLGGKASRVVDLSGRNPLVLRK
jgi:L-threonylcarbamoyladenylate synthase